jgi:hypothetical protein
MTYSRQLLFLYLVPADTQPQHPLAPQPITTSVRETTSVPSDQFPDGEKWQPPCDSPEPVKSIE